MFTTVLIGIFIAVAAGLILYYGFGIGKPEKITPPPPVSTGIKIGPGTAGAKVNNNFIAGFDTGIDNQGIDSEIEENSIRK